jgi:hypothetical protein
MSGKPVIARLWAPLTLGAASTVALGFATNLLTADKPHGWWWWAVLAAGILGLVASGIWGYVLQTDRSPAATAAATQGDAGGAQQVASGGININANNNSAAALHMGEVNIGHQKDDKPNTL